MITLHHQAVLGHSDHLVSNQLSILSTSSAFFPPIGMPFTPHQSFNCWAVNFPSCCFFHNFLISSSLITCPGSVFIRLLGSELATSLSGARFFSVLAPECWLLALCVPYT